MAATPPGPTTSTTALRTLLTDERDGYYAEFGTRRAAGQGVSPPVRPRRQLLELPPAPLRRARRRRPARAVRRLLPEPRPGRQPRVRRPAAARGSPAGGILHAALAVRAAAVHGRGVRRAGAVSVLLRPHRRARSPRRRARAAAQEFAAFAAVRRGDPRPPGPGHVRALQAHAASGDPAIARALRASCCRPAASCPPGEADAIEFDEDAALAARPPRAVRAGLQLRPAEPARVPCAGDARSSLATHGEPRDAATAYVELAPLSGALIR